MASSPRSVPQASAEHDPFDSVLNLEAQYYTEGYNLGVSDGSKAGRIEGRIFGLEKGFEKFAEMGRLVGRAAVWSSRLSNGDADLERGGEREPAKGKVEGITVPRMSGSEKLRKHVQRLSDLADPETLPTENSEDAVSEYDDRLKDARAKATLISKLVGEDEASISPDSESRAGSSGITSRTPARFVRLKKNDAGKATGEIEDSDSLPGLKKTLK